MDRGLAVLLTLAVGALVAFQPPANALLARHVGDLGAAFVSLVISTVIIGVLLVGAGQVGELRGVGEMRPEHVLGGIAGAAVVLVSLVAVRPLGAGGVAAALVATQLIFAALADRYRLLGLPGIDFDAGRYLGVLLLIVGTLLLTRP